MDLTSIVEFLRENDLTISTMESCTGGLLASSITDIKGASEVLKFSAVTYSNEYKIKMGVNKNTIDTYTVYSMEVAREMALKISEFSDSDIGIGITGRLEDVEESVDLAIYYKRCNEYFEIHIDIEHDNRYNEKLQVITAFINLFNEKIKKGLN